MTAELYYYGVKKKARKRVMYQRGRMGKKSDTRVWLVIIRILFAVCSFVQEGDKKLLKVSIFWVSYRMR